MNTREAREAARLAEQAALDIASVHLIPIAPRNGARSILIRGTPRDTSDLRIIPAPDGREAVWTSRAIQARGRFPKLRGPRQAARRDAALLRIIQQRLAFDVLRFPVLWRVAIDNARFRKV